MRPTVSSVQPTKRGNVGARRRPSLAALSGHCCSMTRHTQIQQANTEQSGHSGDSRVTLARVEVLGAQFGIRIKEGKSIFSSFGKQEERKVRCFVVAVESLSH